MIRTTRWAVVGAAIALATAAAQARHGGYGWNEWGATSSGGVGRGLGNLYAGRGA